jgi:hypothetical protein
MKKYTTMQRVTYYRMQALQKLFNDPEFEENSIARKEFEALKALQRIYNEYDIQRSKQLTDFIENAQ